MAYADLYSDAIYYQSLNNTGTVVTSATQNGTVAGAGGSYLFVADTPSGLGSTHSLQASGYSTLPYTYAYNNIPTSSERTVTFWFKFEKATGGLFSVGENSGSALTIATNDPSSASTDNDLVQISFGTYANNTGGTDRKPNWLIRETTISTGTATNSSASSGHKIEQGMWNHIAYIERLAGNNIERAIYVNGVCHYYTVVTGRAFTYSWGTATTSGFGWAPFKCTTNSDTAGKRIAHYAMWNRALTVAEIREQAWYGKSSDYIATVLADDPSYITYFDNEDKATDATVAGTNGTSWGPLNDTAPGIVVNELGIVDKSWRSSITATGTNNYRNNTDADMMSGLASLYRSGEFSIEFWFKLNGKPVGDREIFVTFAPSQNDGYFRFYIDSVGRLQYSGSFKSGTTTYSTTSVGASGQTGTVGGTLFPGDNSASLNLWGDDQWHHVVYTQSNTDNYGGTGIYYGQIFIDGYRYGTRNFTNTYGWVNGTNPLTYFRLGISQTNTALKDVNIDNFATYARRLTDTEIADHFIAGKTYAPPATRTVKYWDGATWADSTAQKVWNGTAWVEWDASYYDGTSWIAL